MPGFQSFNSFLCNYVYAELSTSSIRVKDEIDYEMRASSSRMFVGRFASGWLALVEQMVFVTVTVVEMMDHFRES